MRANVFPENLLVLHKNPLTAIYFKQSWSLGSRIQLGEDGTGPELAVCHSKEVGDTVSLILAAD